MNFLRIKIFVTLFSAVFAVSLSYASAPAPCGCSVLKYNNPDLTVDLGVGLWGIPIPTDYNGDGLTDLIVSCPDRPYRGLYLFINIGTAKKPLFDRAVRISNKGLNNIKLSQVDGVSYVLSNETEHIDFFERPYARKAEIVYEGARLNEGYKRSRSNMWSYVDWDGDGDKDIIVGIDTWDDYGWDNAFDASGAHGAPLVEGQGAEITAAKAPAIVGQRKPNLLNGGHASLRNVGGVEGAHIRKRIYPIQLLAFKGRHGGILHQIPVFMGLNQAVA